MTTITTVAEFMFDLMRVVKRCKLDDYEAGDAIAFTEGYQVGATQEEAEGLFGTTYKRRSPNPYVEGTVRHVMWKQGEVASIVDGGVKYE